MTSKVRLRFAPSPTGNPHIGNIRTAIFAWLFARKHGGDYMIRVEDTDQGRRTDGAVESMLESLEWVGLDWDEGPDVKGPHVPYIQSKRLGFYQKAAEDLIASGHAYRCYCSPERLIELRRVQQERGDETIGYDRRCLKLTDSQRREYENSGAPYVVRFRMPTEGKSTLDDIIFGHLEFENRLYDDFVALKSDGFPTYHLASVVDDHKMGITHVTRGKEWLPSVPRHVQLYSAFGWHMPEFAHMPMILAPDKTKLSKRHGAASVMDYRDMGVLPEALMNYLTLLGWSLDDHSEIFTTDELIQSFELERVSKSDAVFDRAKLDWLNGQHIRRTNNKRLTGALARFWQDDPPEFDVEPDEERVGDVVPLVRERLKTLQDAAPLVKFVFSEEVPLEPGQLVQRGMDAEGTVVALREARDGLAALDGFDTQAIEDLLRPMAKDLDIKVGQLLGSLRAAVTGQKVSPPLFESLEVLGRKTTISRIEDAIAALENSESGD
jgi:glutamyl-tRNA synthetase